MLSAFRRILRITTQARFIRRRQGSDADELIWLKRTGGTQFALLHLYFVLGGAPSFLPFTNSWLRTAPARYRPVCFIHKLFALRLAAFPKQSV